MISAPADMMNARLRPLWIPSSMIATFTGPTGTAQMKPVSAPAPMAMAYWSGVIDRPLPA